MTKIFKYQFLVIVLILGMASCNIFSHDKKDNQASEIVETEGTSENEDSVRTGINDAVYQYQELAKQVETLNDSIVTVKAEFGAHILQVKGDKKAVSWWRIITIGAVGLAVIALMSTLYYKRKIKQLAKRFDIKYNELKEKLETLPITPQWQWQQKKETNAQIPSVKGYNLDLEKRVSVLENEIKNFHLPQSNTITPSQLPTTNKVGYAKTNSEDMFTEILSSKKEGCVYKITYLNEKEGEFDIIELSMLQQTPNYKEVVEVVDGCPLSEATKYKVVSPGRCVKIKSVSGAIAWKVTDKLKIKTLK